MQRKKVLFLITKSNWGENENCFSFSPVLNKVKEQSLSSCARQTVGGPTQLLDNLFSLSYYDVSN